MKNEIPKKGQWGVAVLTHSRAQCPYSHGSKGMSHVASSQTIFGGYIFNQNNVFVFTTLSDSCCYIIYYIFPHKKKNLQALVVVGSRDSRAGRTGLAGSRSAEDYGISV